MTQGHRRNYTTLTDVTEVARIQRVLEQIAPGTATPHNGMAGEEEEAGLRVTD